MSRNYMDMQLKKATSHLARLVHKGSFIKGNIVTMKRTCGYPNCRCAVEGKKHVSMYIGKKQDGTTKMIYVPKRLEEEVEKKINAYLDWWLERPLSVIRLLGIVALAFGILIIYAA